MPPLNDTPEGRVPPVRLNVGEGGPVAVTVNDPGAPTENAALFALVKTGAWYTVSVKLCSVLVTLFVAVKVSA